jgi:hypothetical protein
MILESKQVENRIFWSAMRRITRKVDQERKKVPHLQVAVQAFHLKKAVRHL